MAVAAAGDPVACESRGGPKPRSPRVMTDNGASAPFTVALLTGNGENDATPVPLVLGKTYGAQLVLSAYGGHFDKSRMGWVFPTEKDARDAVADCSRLYVLGQARRTA